MEPRLPLGFFARPIAHRALHDVSDGRPENSLAAVRAAVAAGYGIEIDLQGSVDGVAMVFHDYDLGRLTGVSGPVAQRSMSDLGCLPLLGGDEGVPTLSDVLEIVAGQVPLLVEFKDQDGAMGPNVGGLEAAAAGVLRGYAGPLAVMSFNPHSVAALSELLPDVPRGLTTCAYAAQDWPTIPSDRRVELAEIRELERVGASFISHEAADLDAPRVAEIAAAGLDILCWTIRSPEAETEARRIAANVTFEGYLPA